MAKRRAGRRTRPGWSSAKEGPGLVHVYTGDGKGKTTSAIGLIVRAAGHGMRCCLVQFMKGKYPYGEIRSLKRLGGVTVRQFGTLEFVHKGKEREVDRREARKALDYAAKALASGRFDLVVLDEVCVAEHMGLVKADDIVKALKARAKGVEAVLTGRRADKALLALADYVTSFDKVAHPFDGGILARKGIEF